MQDVETLPLKRWRSEDKTPDVIPSDQSQDQSIQPLEGSAHDHVGVPVVDEVKRDNLEPLTTGQNIEGDSLESSHEPTQQEVAADDLFPA